MKIARMKLTRERGKDSTEDQWWLRKTGRELWESDTTENQLIQINRPVGGGKEKVGKGKNPLTVLQVEIKGKTENKKKKRKKNLQKNTFKPVSLQKCGEGKRE